MCAFANKISISKDLKDLTTDLVDVTQEQMGVARRKIASQLLEKSVY